MYMTQVEFEQIYHQLSDRRKEVLKRLLAGKTDKEIAESLKIAQATVRKNVERIAEAFHLNDSLSPGRSRRSDLVSLAAQFKPELLKLPGAIRKSKLKNLDNDISQIIELLQQIESTPSDLELTLEFFVTSNKDPLNPHIGRWLKKTGYKKYMAGDFHSAIFYFRWASKFDESPSIYYNWGSAYEKLGDHWKAYYYYDCAAVHSNHRAGQAAISNLARLDILNNNPEQAIDRINQVFTGNTHPDIKSSLYKNLGWAYLLQEKYSKAEELIRQAIELDTTNSPRAAPYCLLAQALEAQDQISIAHPCWENCLKYDSYTIRTVATPWRSPELEMWQQQARLRLKKNSDIKDLLLENEGEEISLPP